MKIWYAGETGRLDDPIFYAPCGACRTAPERTMIARIADVDEDALSALLKEGPLDRSVAKTPTFTEARLQPEVVQVPIDLAPPRPWTALLAIVAAIIAATGLLGAYIY